MFENEYQFASSNQRKAIYDYYRIDEEVIVEELIKLAKYAENEKDNVAARARELVSYVRLNRKKKGGLDSFLATYDLSSEEGIALMCLAEALLRIPDKSTQDKLIKDKIGQSDWEKHLGKGNSWFVNAATWAMMLTGKVLEPKNSSEGFMGAINKLISRSGEPIIRKSINTAMEILGKQFVMGETITDAIKRAKTNEKNGFRYSYDMLGEAARTKDDALKYFKSYMDAIEKVGKASNGKGPIDGPGISVKLSALHPRYELAKQKVVFDEMFPIIMEIVLKAKEYNIGLTIDAEESDRLDLSLDLIERVIKDDRIRDWDGFGLAVQAYQKRATKVLDWLHTIATRYQQKLMVRLVKGAYWDSEIKWAQELGLTDYPVFTRKVATDVSYIACVKKLFKMTDYIYPQFATHNAYSVATVLEYAPAGVGYEFQCLHGMGESLYLNNKGGLSLDVPCRIYAPCGGHENLLAYLVRRLLENGANSSFVNRIVNDKVPIDDFVQNPVDLIEYYDVKRHPKIPVPKDLYGDLRPNSSGVDLHDINTISNLIPKLEDANIDSIQQQPDVDSAKDIKDALKRAELAFLSYSQKTIEERALLLANTAQMLEKERDNLIALLMYEGKKTINDAISEVREAVDFCWYYREQMILNFNPKIMPGPTGEINKVTLHGRGVVACISPWNFPLAIFLGQIIAALASGNCVISKSAGQTTRIAKYAVSLLVKAGFDKDVVQFINASGKLVGDNLLADERIRGLMFTGSTETAKAINKILANKEGPIVPFVAETGGQNVMIVDSSALLEQVVHDVITSAFGSAGQRCSALRVLYIQDEIADKFITMLKGAMLELKVSNTISFSTDIGPLIDEKQLNTLTSHKEYITKVGTLISEATIDKNAKSDTFFAPLAVEIDSIRLLKEEIFGPILHVIRYKSNELSRVVDDVNSTGFGLTFGIQSRIEETVNYLIKNIKVGNIYINRNMIGAVVGVQPFGGEGLSGTGPKAGGPHYLLRLATERTVCVNTTAAGGNATLMSLAED